MNTKRIVYGIGLVIGISLIVFTFLSNYLGMLNIINLTSLHLLFLLPMIFIHYPLKSVLIKKQIARIIDSLLALAGMAAVGWMLYRWSALIVSALTVTDMIFATIGIIVLIEISRRVMGAPLTIIVIVFLLYAFLPNKEWMGAFSHNVRFSQSLQLIWFSTQGVFGGLLNITASIIILFIFLGSILQAFGADKSFVDLARLIVGKQKGYVVKVPIIMSSLFGTMSGSSVSNVAVTGTMTIPMMIKGGVRRPTAAALEAVASTGGQLVPPILGATAFIIADFLGLPYGTIVLAAIIPAILYYINIYVRMHYYAKKLDLPPNREELPPLGWTLYRSAPLLSSILLIMILLVMRFQETFAITLSVIWLVVFSMLLSVLSERGKIISTIKRLANGFTLMAKTIIPISVVTALAGIIVAVLGATGLSFSLTAVIGKVDSLPIVLITIAIMAIILGMGMPTPAAYVILATIGAPILINYDVAPLAAHMFVFYFAVLSSLTPPVAIAAFVGAGIANTSFWKSGVTSFNLILTAIPVPFMFVYAPFLLFQGDILIIELIAKFIVACIGIYGLAVGFEGYFYKGMIPIILRFGIIVFSLLGFIMTNLLVQVLLLIGLAICLSVTVILQRKHKVVLEYNKSQL